MFAKTDRTRAATSLSALAVVVPLSVATMTAQQPLTQQGVAVQAASSPAALAGDLPARIDAPALPLIPGSRVVDAVGAGPAAATAQAGAAAGPAATVAVPISGGLPMGDSGPGRLPAAGYLPLPQDPVPAPESPFRTTVPEADMLARLGDSLSFARSYVGRTPYVWGGESPAGWDCSGMVQYTYSVHAIDLPRTAEEQFHAVNQISAAQAVPGDLVFFPRSDGFVYHVALYAGNGMIVEARNTTINTVYDEIWASDVTFGTVRNLGSRPGGFVTSRESSAVQPASTPEVGAWTSPLGSTSSVTAAAPAPAAPTGPAATPVPAPAPGPTAPHITPAAGTPTSSPSPAAKVTTTTPSAPAATTSASPTASGTPQPSATASPVTTTPTPSATPSPTPTASATETATPTPTAPASATPPVTTPPPPASVTLRSSTVPADADGDTTTPLSVAVSSSVNACVVGQVVTASVSLDGVTWTVAGTKAADDTGSAVVTWTHLPAARGDYQVRFTTEASTSCAASSVKAAVTLAQPTASPTPTAGA